MKWRKLPVIIEAEQHMGPEPLLIATLEGTMTAEPGDYIITGVEGERYPCKPGIFRKTYELADARVEPAPSPQPEMPEGWVTHEDARAILRRFNDGHWNNPGEHARYSIPARPEHDDDLRLARYIDQNEQTELARRAAKDGTNG